MDIVKKKKGGAMNFPRPDKLMVIGLTIDDLLHGKPLVQI